MDKQELKNRLGELGITEKDFENSKVVNSEGHKIHNEFRLETKYSYCTETKSGTTEYFVKKTDYDIFSVFREEYQEEDYGHCAEAPHSFIGVFSTAEKAVKSFEGLPIEKFKAQYGDGDKEYYVVASKLDEKLYVNDYR